MDIDETVRARLEELLLDRVPMPSEAERAAMFERTFAAEPGAGAELLPPSDLFDPAPDQPDGSGEDGPFDGEPGGAPRAEPGGEPGGELGDEDWSDVAAPAIQPDSAAGGPDTPADADGEDEPGDVGDAGEPGADW